MKGDLTVRRARDGEEIARARRQDLRARRRDRRHRRRGRRRNRSPASWAASIRAATRRTTDVLIESALWDPLNIAQTGRRLGINTDARYRFERGVDPAFRVPGPRSRDAHGPRALRRRGRPRSSFAGEIPEHRPHHRLPLDRGAAPDRPRPAARRRSKRHPRASSASTSSGAGDRVEGAAAVLAPRHRGQGRSRRGDHPHRRARPHRAAAAAARSRRRSCKPVLTRAAEAHPARQARARGARPRRGRDLVLHRARTRRSSSAAATSALALANPIASDLSDMRPSLLPGLLKAAQRNADRGFGDVALFEVGQCFAERRAGGPDDRARPACGAARARAEGVGRHWDGGARAVDAFDAKADAMALLTALGVPTGGRAGRARRARLVPSRPLGDAAVRAEEHRSAPSARCTRKVLQRARRQGPARRLRDHARRAAAAEAPADQDQAEARRCPSSSR